MDKLNNSLCWLVKHTDYDLVQYLIDNGANVNYQDCAPMRNALNDGTIEMVQLLFQNGSIVPENVYVNVYCDHFESKIDLIFKLNYGDKLDHKKIIIEIFDKVRTDKDILERLLEYVSDDHFYNELYETLLNKSYYSYYKLKILIDKGVVVKSEHYPRIISSLFYCDVKTFIMDNIIDINFDNNYVFRYACRNQNLGLIEWLLQMGVDICCCNNFAIKMACCFGENMELFHYLIKNGADLFCCNGICFVLASDSIFDYLKEKYPDYCAKMREISLNHKIIVSNDYTIFDKLEKLIVEKIDSS
jgi:ankyrin repeat protein